MTTITDAAALASDLVSERPPLLLDARWSLAGGDDRAGFEAGHLPGARFVGVEADLTGPGDDPAAGRHPLPRPEEFQAAMRRVGVEADRAVVAYDAGSSMAAARLWWLLTDAGLDDVSVLDGGFAAWTSAGLPVETGAPDAIPASRWEAWQGRRGRLDAAGVEAALAAGHSVVDVRAAERYRGDVEPIDPVAGHIPGSVNVPIDTLVEPDGRLRNAAAIRERLGDLGPGDVLSCGSGITASLALLAYEAAGGRGAVIYPGSYSGWLGSGRPAARG